MKINVRFVDEEEQLITASEQVAFSKAKKLPYLFVKRLFDIVMSIIGCIMIIPIALVVKIAYMLSGDFAPIFFSQKRIGVHGKEFNFYKFRTMVPNADEVLHDILRDPEQYEHWVKFKKLKNDPRISKCGKFLRKTSLDEFPQFINILKGDMAIVGNRPYLPREKRDMGEYYESVTVTKGGLLSYWAVKGRNDLSFDQRLKLEDYYSKNQSISLDAKIFFGAFSVVFKCKGAK